MTCPVCADDLPIAKAVLSCGHTFCTKCILDNVALNIGSAEGTSRDKCPMCREKICQEVLPSTTHQIRLDDLSQEVHSLDIQLTEQNETIAKLEERLYQERERYSMLINLYNKKNESHELSKFKACMRKNTIKRLQSDVNIINEMLFQYIRHNEHNEYDLERMRIHIQNTICPPEIYSDSEDI